MWEKNTVRARAAASIAVTAALIGTAAAVTSSPAVSDVPADNTCNDAFPVADLERGDLVTSLTVAEGTTPTEFPGEIIGVMEDGIAPGIPMIMARMDVASLGQDDVDGIWAGMSGSPVYADDDRLIGAIAYGLTWGSSNVAGITPYEAMDQYLPEPPAPRVAVSGAQARTIARSSEVSRDEAEQGFTQLRVPQRTAGLTSQRISRLKEAKGYGKFRKNDFLNKLLSGVGGTVSGKDSAPADLVPGGNLAASMAYGDITMGGVGTVTAVCGDDLVGFGHPATFLGDTTLTLHPADALYIQNDPLGVPFKIANFGDPAGTIDSDHLAGIAGFVGAVPDTAEISSDVTWVPSGAQRAGSTDVSVKEANASAVFYEHLANHDRVVDAITEGSELLSWEVTGTDEAGDPFALEFTDRYASDYDISYESSWELADLVYSLSVMPGVTVDSVSSVSTADDDASVYRIKGMEQKRNGDWVKLTNRKDAVVKAGGELIVRALLEGSDGSTETRTVKIDVPDDVRKRAYFYMLGGGYDYLGIWGADSMDDVEKAVEGAVRGDEVMGLLYTRGGDSGRRHKAGSTPTDKVVYGERYASVKIIK